MKKRLKEGRGGFKHVKLLISIILFFLFSQFTLAQINLNGFGVLSKFPSFKNKTNLFSLDYNQDSFIDLITFGSSNERVTFHPGSGKGFDKAIDKFFYYLINDIKLFNNIDDLGQHYIFISRKEKLGGLVSFTKYGTLTLLNRLTFNSYPSSICTGDIDNDGILEAIVAGKNFDGMSLLSQEQFRLNETPILSNRIFSEVQLADLDYDKYPEIIAFDELDNSIVILANDQDEGFRDERKVKINSKASNLLVEDYNRDGFIDIIFSNNKEIRVLEGDSVSSFDNRKTILNNIVHDKFLFTDLNNDEHKDFIFLCKKSGDIKTAFSNNDNTFSRPVVIYSNNNIEDIISFKQAGVKSIGLVDKKGNVFTLQNINFGSSFNIAASCSPNIFGSAKSSNSLSYFYYLDDINPTFVMYEVDSMRKLNKYYSHRLTSTYNEIKFSKTNKNDFQFLLFNKLNNFFDVLVFLPVEKEFQTKRIFTQKPIIDVDFYESQNAENQDKFSVLSLTNGIITVENYDNSMSDQLMFTQFVDSNAVAGLIKAGESDTVYYWSKSDSLFKLTRYSQLSSEFISDILVENDTLLYPNPPSSYWVNDGENIQFHSFNYKSDDSFLMFNQNIYDANLFMTGKNINPKSIKAGFDKKKNKFSVWTYSNNKLKQLLLDETHQKVKLIYSIDYLECKDYFVSEFSNNIKYLIYTTSLDNYLTLKIIE